MIRSIGSCQKRVSFIIVYLFVCLKMYKVKGKKLFKMSWRGSPREATGLIRNGLSQ